VRQADRLRTLLIIGLCLLVTACAVRPPQPSGSEAGMALEQWTPATPPGSWRLSGRASLQLDGEGATASLGWAQADAGYRIDLRGAFGAGSLRVTGDDEGVELLTADGERYTAESPRELVRAVTGYDLPVSFLRHWVTGHPVPWLSGRVRLDAAGHPVMIRQGEWRIAYEGFRSVAGHDLPERLAVERGATSVRIVIGDWRIR
jgi:outer membrane lipoprotein LolB